MGYSSLTRAVLLLVSCVLSFGFIPQRNLIGFKSSATGNHQTANTQQDPNTYLDLKVNGRDESYSFGDEDISRRQLGEQMLKTFGLGVILSQINPGTASFSNLFDKSKAFAADTGELKVEAYRSGGKVAVLGAGGRTGKLCVSILASLGVPVLALTRTTTSDTYKYFSDPSHNFQGLVTAGTADVRDKASLLAALKDCDAVIFASSASKKGGNAKEVDEVGVANTAEAALEAKVRQLVVISSGAVTRPASFAYKFTNLFGNIMDAKINGENDLRAQYRASSGSVDADGGVVPPPSPSYCIIRPGGLKEGAEKGVNGNANGEGSVPIALSPPSATLELNQGDAYIGEIDRLDVARAAVAAAISPSIPPSITFEVYSKQTRSPLEKNVPQKTGYEAVVEAGGGGSGGVGDSIGAWSEAFRSLAPDGLRKD